MTAYNGYIGIKSHQEVVGQCRSGPDAETDSQCCAVHLLLGLGRLLLQVNQRYLPQLCQVLTFPQSVGIVGGRPGASLFFMGVQGDSSVLYLDPHEAQEVREGGGWFSGHQHSNFVCRFATQQHRFAQA
jgi:hypothetical protein